MQVKSNDVSCAPHLVIRLYEHQPMGKQMMAMAMLVAGGVGGVYRENYHKLVRGSARIWHKLVVITLLPGVPGSESMAEGEVGCSDMICKG